MRVALLVRRLCGVLIPREYRTTGASAVREQNSGCAARVTRGPCRDYFSPARWNTCRDTERYAGSSSTSASGACRMGVNARVQELEGTDQTGCSLTRRATRRRSGEWRRLYDFTKDRPGVLRDALGGPMFARSPGLGEEDELAATAILLPVRALRLPAPGPFARPGTCSLDPSIPSQR